MFSNYNDYITTSDEYLLSSSETVRSDDSSFSENLKTKSSKWSNQEDDQLRHLVSLYGTRQWKKIAQNLPGRSAVQCSHRFSKINTTELVKGSWTKEEDQKLVQWVNREGPSKWSQAALIIIGRTGKQIRERWFNHLCPNVKTGNWTAEEDETLFELYQKFGTSWSKIAKYLPGRPENTIKNRFYSTLRKVVADKRKSKSAKTAKREQITKEIEENNNNLYIKLSPKIFLSGQDCKPTPKSQQLKVGRDLVTIVLDESKPKQVEISPEDLFVSYSEAAKEDIISDEFDKVEEPEEKEVNFFNNENEAESNQVAENPSTYENSNSGNSEDSVDGFFADFSSNQNSEEQQMDFPTIFDDFVGKQNWNFGEEIVVAKNDNLFDSDDYVFGQRRSSIIADSFFAF